MSFKEMDSVENCVSGMLKGCLETNEGMFRIEIHKDSKNLNDIGKATWYIGDSWTQNHHVLYTANCWDYEIETNCTIDDYISRYDFNDEVLKICNEVWEVWEKINGQ